MRKTILTMVAVMLMLCSSAHAAGLTVSVVTEQVTEVDKGNSIGVDLGYFFGLEGGPGIEPFVGLQWWPRWDDNGDMEPPGVVCLGGRYHFGDIIDSDSAIPFIPDLLLGVLNEEVEAKLYLSGRFTMNFIDKDVGYMGLGTGILLKTTPISPAALRFEIRYGDTFSQLNEVPDNRLNYYFGVHYQF